MHNEKLAGCTIHETGTCHGDDAAYMGNVIFYAVRGKFTLYGLTRATGAISEWVTTLNHKTVNNTVKGQSVVKTFISKIDKIGNRNRCGIRIQFQFYFFTLILFRRLGEVTGIFKYNVCIFREAAVNVVGNQLLQFVHVFSDNGFHQFAVGSV